MLRNLLEGSCCLGSMVAEQREGSAARAEIRAKIRELEERCDQKAKELEENHSKWKMNLEIQLRNAEGKEKEEQSRIMEEMEKEAAKMDKRSKAVIEEMKELYPAAKE